MNCNAAMMLLMVVLSGVAYGEAAEFNLDVRTPLCIAVEEEDLEKVRALVEGGADVSDACSFTKSDYPILIAARTGNIDIGEFLLTRGADVNQVGFLGYTPLLRAGEGLHVQFVELLLKKGADVDDKLIELTGLNLNLGLDMLSLTTASYLRKSLIAAKSEQDGLDKAYAAILDTLFTHCFDFEKFGEISETRLRSEGHSEEATLVSDLASKKPPSC